MAQSSFPWAGDSGAGGTGDCGPYSSLQFAEWLMLGLLCRDPATQYVVPGKLNELAVTGAATPLAVNTGKALVDGWCYNNSSSVSVPIATPVSATRIDRVVLRYDSTLQTVRLVLLPGAEGGAAPALTQTHGTTYEVSLAQVSITTGGVCTVTDERGYLLFCTKVSTAMVEDDAITPAKIANRTRTFLVQAPYANNATDGLHLAAASAGWSMTDNKICDGLGWFYLPSDYVSGLTIKAVVEAAASGNCYAGLTVLHAAAGEAYGTHSDVTATAAIAVTANQIAAIATVTPTNVGAGDYFAMTFERVGNDALDTVGNVVYFKGFLVSYTADS